ncbi:hypothetical protein DPMN_176298 [Dreissena polymorpha]|uniref:Uncharacterized protein n=1 Tax=Dreissena polymorpha TaxID=45954 RepID=A0A9D4IJ19_DREPO|nr:hypothetical protein DPMN_176298 [Dreissena polymorpha]
MVSEEGPFAPERPLAPGSHQTGAYPECAGSWAQAFGAASRPYLVLQTCLAGRGA